MRRKRDLIEERIFEHEEFQVHGKVYDVILYEKYSRKTKNKYAVELVLQDERTGESHSYTDTISKRKIGSTTKRNTLFDRILRRAPNRHANSYESLYDFVIASVIEATREARDERNQKLEEPRSQSPEAQAETAFESLEEM